MTRSTSATSSLLMSRPVLMILKPDDLGEVHSLPQQVRQRWYSHSEATNVAEVGIDNGHDPKGSSSANLEYARSRKQAHAGELPPAIRLQNIEARLCAAQRKRLAHLDTLKEKAATSRPQMSKLVSLSHVSQATPAEACGAAASPPCDQLPRCRSSSKLTSPKSGKLRSPRVIIRINARATAQPASDSAFMKTASVRRRSSCRNKFSLPHSSIYRSFTRSRSRKPRSLSRTSTSEANDARENEQHSPSSAFAPPDAPCTPPRNMGLKLRHSSPLPSPVRDQCPTGQCSSSSSSIGSANRERATEINNSAVSLQDVEDQKSTSQRSGNGSKTKLQPALGRVNTAQRVRLVPEDLQQDVEVQAQREIITSMPTRKLDEHGTSGNVMAFGDKPSREQGTRAKQQMCDRVSAATMSSMFPHRAKYMAFDRLAETVQRPETLARTRALLQLLEKALLRCRGSRDDQVNALLCRLYSSSPASSSKMERYPPRVFLSAYMMTAHPEVVFNHQGPVQQGLQAAAENLLGVFEEVLEQLHGDEAEMLRSMSEERVVVLKLLNQFDAAWLNYLGLFVSWKLKDAAIMENHLIKMAVALETSLLHKLGPHSFDSLRVQRSPDLQAMIQQVAHDHCLMRERLRKLTGSDGASRMDDALAQARQKIQQHMGVGPSHSTSQP